MIFKIFVAGDKIKQGMFVRNRVVKDDSGYLRNEQLKTPPPPPKIK